MLKNNKLNNFTSKIDILNVQQSKSESKSLSISKKETLEMNSVTMC